MTVKRKIIHDRLAIEKLEKEKRKWMRSIDRSDK